MTSTLTFDIPKARTGSHSRRQAATHDLGLLALRAAAGLTLAGHGAQKLFGWWDGPGMDFMVKSLHEGGYTPARFFAYLLGASELLGGLFLAIGLLTPLASAAVVGVMFNAVVGVHWKAGIWAQNGGYEMALLFGVAAVAIALTGPGRFSVDRHRPWASGGAGPALFSLALGLSSALAVMAVKAL